MHISLSLYYKSFEKENYNGIIESQVKMKTQVTQKIPNFHDIPVVSNFHIF